MKSGTAMTSTRATASSFSCVCTCMYAYVPIDRERVCQCMCAIETGNMFGGKGSARMYLDTERQKGILHKLGILWPGEVASCGLGNLA